MATKREWKEKVRALEAEREGWRDWIRFLRKNLRQIRDKLDSWPVGTCWPEGRKQIRDLTEGCEDTHWDEAALDADPEDGPYPSTNSPEVKVAAAFTTEILREMVNRAEKEPEPITLAMLDRLFPVAEPDPDEAGMQCNGNCGPTENCPIWESWEHTGEVNRKLREENANLTVGLAAERRRNQTLLVAGKGYREEIAGLSNRLTDRANAHEADVLRLNEKIEALEAEREAGLKAIGALRKENNRITSEANALRNNLNAWEAHNQEKLDEMREALADQGGWSSLRSRAHALRREAETLLLRPQATVTVNSEAAAEKADA